MSEPLSSKDIRVLGKYRNAGVGAWTTMPEEDRAVYRKIHERLAEVASHALAQADNADLYDHIATSGFKVNSGVRGNRPKDLWCTLCNKGSADLINMPQIFVIVSVRGVEIGFAASIHPSDFSNQAVKKKLRAVVPVLFDALPAPDSNLVATMSNELAGKASKDWRFRSKTRLDPGGSDFNTLTDLIRFLRSDQGKKAGGGAISRYIEPEKLDDPDIDLTKEYAEAVQMFAPLMQALTPARVASGTQPKRFWVEKTLVAGRPDRERGEHRLGAALWSPRASTDGKDIYRAMREVRPSDIVIHLIDNQHIVGLSVAAEHAKTDFVGLEGSKWAGRPSYRIQLKDYANLDPPIDRTEFFDVPEVRARLRRIQENHKGLFYTSSLELNQGHYLTEAPIELVNVFDDIYRKKTGRGLPHLTPGEKRVRTSFKRHRLEGAVTLFKWIYGEDGFRSQRYLQEERDYKQDLSREWRSVVTEDALAAAIEGNEPAGLASTISNLLGPGRSNLLPWRYHDAVKKTAEGELARTFLETVRKLIFDGQTGVPNIEQFNESMLPAYQAFLPETAQKPASHCIPSMILWLTHPREYFYLRPELYTRTVRALTGKAPAGAGNIMSNAYYAEALSFASDLSGALHVLEPRDMIDVQGFAWGVFSHRKIWFGGKTYGGTQDMLPEFLKRRVYATGYGAEEKIVNLLRGVPDLRSKAERDEIRQKLEEACENHTVRNAIVNLFELITEPNSLLIAKSTFADKRTRESKLRAFGIARTNKGVSFDEAIGHQIPVTWLDTFEHTVSIGSYFPRVNTTLSSLPMEDALDMLFPKSGEKPGVQPPDIEVPELTLQWLAGVTLWDESNLQEIIDSLFQGMGQIVLTGPPGTGKTWLAKHLARYLTGDDNDRLKFIQFHPSYGYEEFIEGIQPIAKDGSISFEPKDGVVLDIVEGMNDEDLPYVLVIDEMNRANLSRVFGELMYLLEYRDETIQLQYSPNFSLPRNLLFIGTMNTADRSIRSIDVALRRRFDVFECKPDRKTLERYYVKHQNAVPDLLKGFDTLNSQLEENLDRHHTIGHTFFMSPNMTADQLRRTWDRKIYPLIEEYFFDQPTVLGGFTISKFWSL